MTAPAPRVALLGATGAVGAEILQVLEERRFPVRELLSRPYRLEEADQALKDLAAGKFGRPVIDMGLR